MIYTDYPDGTGFIDCIAGADVDNVDQIKIKIASILFMINPIISHKTNRICNDA